MLVIAVVCNGDRMSPINILGLLVCLGGIVSHVTHKVKTLQHNGLIRAYNVETEKFETAESLMNDLTDTLSVSSHSESEMSDTQVLFSILNRHDR